MSDPIESHSLAVLYPVHAIIKTRGQDEASSVEAVFLLFGIIPRCKLANVKLQSCFALTLTLSFKRVLPIIHLSNIRNG